MRNLRIALLLSLATSTLFTNCSKFSSANFSSVTTTYYGDGLADFPKTIEPLSQKEASEQTGIKLLSGEQLVRSYSQMTGVTANGVIATEYALQSNSLADNPYLSSITGPLWIGSTDLASRFCNQLITRESALAAGSRRFFASVDFNGPVANLSGAAFNAMVTDFGQKIWGRAVTANEQSIVEGARLDFVNAITATPAATTHTRNLVLYTCTGMLSALDSLIY